MFCTFTVLLKKRQKKKRRLYIFEWKNPEEKQNSTTTMMSADEKSTVLLVKLKLPVESFEKRYLKNLINLIVTNKQINMSSDHSVSNNS